MRVEEAPALDVARLWLACTWILAGGLKAMQPSKAREFVRRNLRVSPGAAVGIVVTASVSEIAIGVSLLMGFMVAQTAGVAVVVVVAFTVIVVLSPEMEGGCGCFGALDVAADNRWFVMSRNGAMIAAALFVSLGHGPVGEAAFTREPLTWLFAMILVGLSGIAYFVGARLLLSRSQGFSGISNVQ